MYRKILHQCFIPQIKLIILTKIFPPKVMEKYSVITLPTIVNNAAENFERKESTQIEMF